MKRIIAITGAMILSAAHCPAAAPQLDSRNYPKVDGSTSTQALQCLIKSRILGKNVVVPHTDTEKSYANLIQGRTDLILVAREPSREETAIAAQKGVKLDINTIALDALVFVVNKSNGVNNLTTDQIRKIYSKKITYWHELGIMLAPVGPIGAYRRDRLSGSEELMKSLVMRDVPFSRTVEPYVFGGRPRDVPDEMVVFPMGRAIMNIADKSLGLTYTIYYYVKYVIDLVDVKEKCLQILLKERATKLKLLDACDLRKTDQEYWAELRSRELERFSDEEKKSRAGLEDTRKALKSSGNIKMIQVDGVEPNATTIASRKYPFTAEVLVVMRSNEPPESPASRLRDWLLTSAGQEVIAQSGYVPIAGQSDTPHETPDLTADNVALSAGNNQWNWTVFLKGDKTKIDGVKCVEYTLHPTFSDRIRMICEQGDAQRPFGVSVTGWGTFQVGIRVFMKDGTHKEMKHQLKF